MWFVQWRRRVAWKKNGWIRKTSCNFDPPNQRMCVNIFSPFHKHFTQAICTSMKFSCLVKKCRAKKKIATFCYNVVNNQAVKIDRSARTIKVTSEQLSSYVEFISAKKSYINFKNTNETNKKIDWVQWLHSKSKCKRKPNAMHRRNERSTEQNELWALYNLNQWMWNAMRFGFFDELPDQWPSYM